MYKLTLENANGDQLTFNDGGVFSISEIEGLNPPDASINTTEVALIDGVLFNSAKVNARTINIAFAIEYEAAKNRIEVYKVVKSKHPIRLYYKSDYRDVFIDGYVSSIDITYFEMKQIVTVSILCPEPYLKNMQEIINELSSVISMFHFPFASTEEPELVFSYLDPISNVFVANDGDIECGLIFHIYARDFVRNIKIYNYATGAFIGFGYWLQENDELIIDTRRGRKTITRIRDGIESNLFNALMPGSTWLQLNTGGDTFAYDVGEGDINALTITISHYNLFEGV